MNQNIVLTGKPSVDRPWMQFYPKEVQSLQIPKCTLNDYFRSRFTNRNHVAAYYYGAEVTWGEIFDKADKLAKSLKAVGIDLGDKIPAFLRSVPEFIMILFAAEKIGASVMCRDHLPSENAAEVKKMEATVMFIHDFITQEEINEYEAAGIRKFVLLSPYTYAVREAIPEYAAKTLQKLYASAEGREFHAEILTWDEFLALGEDYTGEIGVPFDTERPLYRSYTTGSTGPSKQIIHCARGMIGIIHQMTFYAPEMEQRTTELLAASPPSFVSVVNCGILRSLAANEYLILDSFCQPEEMAFSIMRYHPNVVPLSPFYFKVLMECDQIDENYDMSFLMATGAGGEFLNNGQYRTAQKFLTDHGAKAYITPGYGLSEAGANVVFPSATRPSGNGNSGMPMPLVNVGIFKPGTCEELSYHEYGEICVDTPGLMVGYIDPEETAKIVKIHEDGRKWLHTGDYGYITEDGTIFCYGRGDTKRYGGGDLSEISMENHITEVIIPGLKDAFVLFLEDTEHEGYHLPYLYVVLEDGYTMDDVRDKILAVLNDYEYPVEMIQIPERPFFHFKTNRAGLARELRAKRDAAKN